MEIYWLNKVSSRVFKSSEKREDSVQKELQ